MLYFSEVTKKNYPTEKECLAAEAEYMAAKEKEKKVREEKALARKEQANAIENARKEMVAAQNKYKELIEKFVKDYGSYHYSTKSTKDVPTLFDLFNPFLF